MGDCFDPEDPKTGKRAPAFFPGSRNSISAESLETKVDALSSKVSCFSGLIAFFVVVILALVSGAMGVLVYSRGEIDFLKADVLADPNPCAGAKVDIPNAACATAIADQVEQSGREVTETYTAGNVVNTATPPILTSYKEAGLCPVNVHWHLGAEHKSAGEYDENGIGPTDSWAASRRLASSGVRQGMQCDLNTMVDSGMCHSRDQNGQLDSQHHDCSYYYEHKDECGTMDDNNFIADNICCACGGGDKNVEPYEEYNWKYCKHMKVGQTYEVHWPHSSVGDCGTKYQYQTPFYDGVFCNFPEGGASTHDNVGVQAQVFVIVNDEGFYVPNLIEGALVAGDVSFPDGEHFGLNDDSMEDVHPGVVSRFGRDVAFYTGSTTGTSRDADTTCSFYSPITWQVDRMCHRISASSFDKMCYDMLQQGDDMSDDIYPHGARELVVDPDLISPQEIFTNQNPGGTWQANP